MKYVVRYFIDGMYKTEFEFDNTPFVPNVGDRVFLDTYPSSVAEFRSVYITNIKTIIDVYTKM